MQSPRAGPVFQLLVTAPLHYGHLDRQTFILGRGAFGEFCPGLGYLEAFILPICPQGSVLGATSELFERASGEHAGSVCLGSHSASSPDPDHWHLSPADLTRGHQGAGGGAHD